MDIKAPVYPESITEGIILPWQKNERDFVNEGDLLVEIEIEKIVLEIRAPKPGVLQKILIKEGQTVLSEQVIAEIDTSAAVPSSPPHPQTSSTANVNASVNSIGTTQPAAGSMGSNATMVASGMTTGFTAASPSARRLMGENNINTQDINNGQSKLNKEAVERFIQQGNDVVTPTGTTTSPQSVDNSTKAEQRPSSLESSALGSASPGYRETVTKPMSTIRKTIAQRLLAATNQTAMLTTFNEVDMSRVMELRSRYQEDFQKKHSIKLGFMSFFVRAAVSSLNRYPLVNAFISNDNIVYNNFHDISIAVSAPLGLIVPVIRDCSFKNLAQIETDIADFSDRAKNNKIQIEEMQGGTFTISNGGIFGSLLSTPILNPPQSAILGLHKISDRPVVIDGEIKVRPIMNLALSYDHRIIDGREAVSFLVSVKQQIEEPERFLLDI